MIFSFEGKLKHISVARKEPNLSLFFSLFLSVLTAFSGFLVAFAHCFSYFRVYWMTTTRVLQSKKTAKPWEADHILLFLSNNPRSYSSLTHFSTMFLFCQVFNLKLIWFKKEFEKRSSPCVQSICFLGER